MKKRKNLFLSMVLFALLPAVLVTLALSVLYSVENGRKVFEKIQAASNIQFDTVRRYFNEINNNIEMICSVADPQDVLAFAAEDSVAPTSDLTIGQQESYENEASLQEIRLEKARDIFNSWVTHHEDFNRISLVDRDNNIVLSSEKILEGKPSSIAQGYLRRLSQGESVVTNLFNDEYANNELTFIVAKPLYVNEMYAGFILLSSKTEGVKRIIGKNQIFNSGTVEVMDITNNIIASSNPDISAGQSQKQELIQVLALHIAPSETFVFKDLLEPQIVSYMRMYDTGWVLVYTVSQNEFDPTGFYLFLYISVIIIFIVGLGFAISIVIRKRFTNPLFKLLDNLHNMNAGDYKSRVPYLGKNEFSEIASAFNNLMTKIELDNKELIIKEERYRIANEQSNSVIFEYNVETRGFTCSPNACEFANYPAFMHNFPESLNDMQVLHSEDAAQFMRLFAAMSRGRRTGSMEARLRTYKDEYHWFSLLLTTITDTATFKPLRVVGKLTDIDEEKKMTANLTFKAERDPLTSVYNKSTTQSMITQRLNDRKQDLYYALIVLDVDNFKHVNDGYGHQKGDSVLTDLASALLGQLRSDDVVGRIGGDEFMIMLSAMPSREAVATKANKLLAAIRNIPLDAENGIYLTISMGIALCPQDGTGFNQLYASADNALYVRKNAGKDGFLFYREAGAE